MLGTDLSQELSKDYEVYGLDIAYSVERIAYSLKCDITDRAGTIKTISKIRPDIVIHTAAYTDVDGCELDAKKAYRINSEGTKNIALAAKAVGAMLIYISTDFVFDGKKKKPYKETDRPNPLSTYADSKLKGELAIKKVLKKYFILRTSWLYGKNGRNFVDIILNKAKKEKVLKVVDDQVGSPTYTKDLAKAIRVLLSRVFSTAYSVQRTAFGIYHVSNSGSVSWYNYAKEILRLTGSKVKVIPTTSRELARPAERPAMSVLDNSKFYKFTGYKIRRWNDALKEYLAGSGGRGEPC
jgi:dTDP-4-dehydrorhamnose reductase